MLLRPCIVVLISMTPQQKIISFWAPNPQTERKKLLQFLWHTRRMLQCLGRGSAKGRSFHGCSCSSPPFRTMGISYSLKCNNTTVCLIKWCWAFLKRHVQFSSTSFKIIDVFCPVFAIIITLIPIPHHPTPPEKEKKINHTKHTLPWKTWFRIWNERSVLFQLLQLKGTSINPPWN